MVNVSTSVLRRRLRYSFTANKTSIMLRIDSSEGTSLLNFFRTQGCTQFTPVIGRSTSKWWKTKSSLLSEGWCATSITSHSFRRGSCAIWIYSGILSRLICGRLVTLTIFTTLILEALLRFIICVCSLKTEFVSSKGSICVIFWNYLLWNLSLGFGLNLHITWLTTTILFSMLALYVHASYYHRIFNWLTISHILEDIYTHWLVAE